MLTFIPKSSTKWLLCGILLGASAGNGFAQQAALSLSSGAAQDGGNVGLSLSLTTSGSTQPGALEWTMTYPATEFSGATIAAGAAATAAGTAPTCSSSVGTIKCVLDGTQEAAIANGVVALITLAVPAAAPTGTAAIAITSPVAVGVSGSAIPAASVGGTVSIQATTPTLTGLSCTPASVTSPGSAACTVTLSAAAPTGGSVVTLSSNNTSVTVPASVTVAAGSTTGTFTATVATVSSAVTATLTATTGSSSQTFALAVTPPATWSISGTITPAISGVTVTLSGAASQTSTSNSSGTYTYSGLANGSYTVTPALTGYTFTPASQAVTLNGASQSAVNFTAQTQSYVAPTVDVEISKNQKNASLDVETGSFSTSSANELLLAFVSANTSGATVSGVSGAGLTWSLVVRTSIQSGTAEIWRAFSSNVLDDVTVTATLNKSSASSLTVISFTGVDQSGVNGSGAIGAIATANAASGAPSASFVTTRNDSLVRGVGEDPGAAVDRVAVAGQGLVHQFASNGATYWVQRVNKPVAEGGTTVTLGDSSPTTDPYNLSVVEILAAPPSTNGTTESAMVRAPVIASRPNAGVSSASESPVTMYNPATGATGDVCTPGGLASLSGGGFTSQSPQVAQSVPLPTRLGGVQVKANGEPVGLSFVSASRVNFVCPQLTAGSSVDVAVQSEDGSIQTAASSVIAAVAPSIFTVDATNQGVVQIASSNEIAAPAREAIVSRPAQTGETLTIYATGLGTAEYPVRVAIGDKYAGPASVTSTPLGAGVFQIGATIPEGTTTGPAVPLHLEVILPDLTTVWSNTVTLAIQ